MIRSMTAYARDQIGVSSKRFSIEIHTVNRKNLDINIYLPKEILFLDISIRKWISAKIKRGGVTVRVNFDFDLGQMRQALPPQKALQRIKEAWQAIAVGLGLDPEKEVSLSFLLEQYSKLNLPFSVSDESGLEEAFQTGFLQILQQLIAMKQTEGSFLEKDLRARIDTIQDAAAKIQQLSPRAEKVYRQKLIDRLEEIRKSAAEDQERIQKEVALFAEKIDITEEITRICSHLDQFSGRLNTREESIGKTLDFLLQEMTRETNTINAKSPDLEINQLALTIKTEIEKMREQVQNIE